ncbi:hypothetical protein E1B28_010575 [Marasmius oreades]|uniref:Uncharacterized protein n=1 Tax=Marasmius oreades TaxID=181124 RepID=A0A9P7USU4_9AGAR|nr:uncharacterized protein E1B28_010575 [Marasmius oreades]KAG7091546.1 hypothetical protein E1B28_010575 [Marasmius oreades]
MSPRFFWFLLGAGAATWWSRHHQGHCDGFNHRRRLESSPAPTAQPSIGANAGADQWEVDRARFREVSRQVGDTVTDMSEASLEMLLTTVQAMKEKLAQHRMERERSEAERRRFYETQPKSGGNSPVDAPRHLI